MQAYRQTVKREREHDGGRGGGRGRIDQGWQGRRVRKEGKGWEEAANGKGIRDWGGDSPGGDGEREGSAEIPLVRRANPRAIPRTSAPTNRNQNHAPPMEAAAYRYAAWATPDHSAPRAQAPISHPLGETIPFPLFPLMHHFLNFAPTQTKTKATRRR